MEAKNFNDLLLQAQKKYGKELIRLGNDNAIKGVEWWNLDSLNISDLLGKGAPKGRIIEIYGPESSGKSSFCYYIAGQVQKQNGKVCYIDMEQAVDIHYAQQMGLNLDACLLSQPDFQEQALDIALDIIESKQVDVVVLDSIAALSPLAELEGEMTDQTMGLMARNNSKFFRKVVSMVKKNNVLLLCVNQEREKIGVTYGAPETTPGGKALKYYSSIRIRATRKENIPATGIPYGIICKLKTNKNKIGVPYRDKEMSLIFGKGYDCEREWIDFAINFDIIKKGGAWFTVPEITEKIQGVEKVILTLNDKPELFERIKILVKEEFEKRKGTLIEREEENLEKIED